MLKKNVVVVGAGTAGLVIANNLQASFNVTILEKSKHKNYPFIFRVPMMIGLLFRKKGGKYISNREILLAGERRIPFFESQVVGGASVINGCVHALGMRSKWEEILNKFKFSYHELTQSYTKNYTKDSNCKYKINLISAKKTIIDAVFIQTLNTLGIPSGDMEHSDEQNCGQIYNTVGRIFRSSVLSLLKDGKINISTNQRVDSLQFDNQGSIVGVISGDRIIKADYVILSCGTLGTNQLLMGQGEVEGGGGLGSAIKQKIGKNIQDHVNLRVNIVAKRKIGSFNEIEKSLIKKISIVLSHLRGKPNLLSGTGATSGVHLDLDGDGNVDTRIQIVQFTESGRHGSDGKYFGDYPGFSLSITPINPYSKGNIRYENKSLIIDPGYLSDRRDINLLISALKFSINLLKTEPLSGYIDEIIDLEAIESSPERYITENIYSGHHLIGGVGNIIDENFAVKGVNNLYVCDASIFEGYAASNIHSSVVLMADLFSKRFNLQKNNSF